MSDFKQTNIFHFCLGSVDLTEKWLFFAQYLVVVYVATNFFSVGGPLIPLPLHPLALIHHSSLADIGSAWSHHRLLKDHTTHLIT